MWLETEPTRSGPINFDEPNRTLVPRAGQEQESLTVTPAQQHGRTSSACAVSVSVNNNTYQGRKSQHATVAAREIGGMRALWCSAPGCAACGLVVRPIRVHRWLGLGPHDGSGHFGSRVDLGKPGSPKGLTRLQQRLRTRVGGRGSLLWCVDDVVAEEAY